MSGIAWDRRMGWVRSIVRGVAGLHEEGVTHRNLKSGNIIIMNMRSESGASHGVASKGKDGPAAAEAETAQITDFGSAKVMESLSAGGGYQSRVGVVQYSAPEVLLDEPRDYVRVDVYALSVLVWEILSGQSAYGGQSERKVQEAVCLRKARTTISSELPHGMCEALARGWDGKAGKRGTAKEFYETMFGEK